MILRELAARALLAAFGGSAGLLLAEAAARVFERRLLTTDSATHRFDPELRWVQREGLTATRRNERGERIEVLGSALGIRQPPAGFRAGARSVLLVGDSFTAGTQVPHEQTWAGRLGEALARHRRDLQVVNAGVDGYDLSQSYRLAERLWGAFDPLHLVVAVFVGNDLVDYGAAPSARPPWKPATILDWVRERSYVFHLARGAARRLRDEEEGEDLPNPPAWELASVPGWHEMSPVQRRRVRVQFAAAELLPALRGAEAERRLRSTERMLEAFAALATSHCAGITVLLIPTKQQAVPTQREEWMRLHGLAPEEALRPQAELGRWGAAAGVRVVDATAAFAAAPEPERLFWSVNMHNSPEGHAALAEALLPALAGALSRPGPCGR